MITVTERKMRDEYPVMNASHDSADRVGVKNERSMIRVDIINLYPTNLFDLPDVGSTILSPKPLFFSNSFPSSSPHLKRPTHSSDQSGQTW